jgi:hypothetical protein
VHPEDSWRRRRAVRPLGVLDGSLQVSMVHRQRQADIGDMSLTQRLQG